MDLSKIWFQLVLIGVVVYGLTEGLKLLLPRLRDSWKGVAIRAVPAGLGMTFGIIPGVFPESTFGIALLLGGAAGVFCAYAYEIAGVVTKKESEASNEQ
jgi:hypothetical protein